MDTLNLKDAYQIDEEEKLAELFELKPVDCELKPIDCELAPLNEEDFIFDTSKLDLSLNAEGLEIDDFNIEDK